MSEFFNIALECNNERLISEKSKYFNNIITGENIYVLYCSWCNAFKNKELKNDAETFGEFLKQENIKLTFWQKKYICEKYFNIKIKHNSLLKKWQIED